LKIKGLEDKEVFETFIIPFSSTILKGEKLMKRFLLSILMIFTVLMIIGSIWSVWKNYFSSNEDIRDEEFPPNFHGYISIDGKRYSMNPGGFKWERKKGFSTEVIQTDHASSTQMAQTIEAIPTKPGENINIFIEENPEILVFIVGKNERNTEVKVVENEIFAPEKAGTYIYEVLATWENGKEPAKWTSGKQTYVFVIEVDD
jgi:hypothetical protein